MLAHASTRDATITLTAKRLLIFILLLKDLKKPCDRQGKRGNVRGSIETSALSSILVELSQQVKRFA